MVHANHKFCHHCGNSEFIEDGFAPAELLPTITKSLPPVDIEEQEALPINYMEVANGKPDDISKKTFLWILSAIIVTTVTLITLGFIYFHQEDSLPETGNFDLMLLTAATDDEIAESDPELAFEDQRRDLDKKQEELMREADKSEKEALRWEEARRLEEAQRLEEAELRKHTYSTSNNSNNSYTSNNSSSHDSYNYDYFSSPMDVWSYLYSHKFYYSDIQVKITEYYIEIDGTPCTGAVRLLDFNRTSARLTASSPYLGGASITFVVNCSSGTLSDGHNIYYAK